MISELLGQALIGWLLADLITGMFHWWEDRVGRVEWPIVGPWIIAPNRLHHLSPLAFTRHGFLDRNRASMLAAAIVWALWGMAFGPSVTLATAMIGAGLSNEVHRYAHQPSLAPGWVRVLQQIGIVQSPNVHKVHHRPPFEQNFCILTDWLNPPLEALGFWRVMERLFGLPKGGIQ